MSQGGWYRITTLNRRARFPHDNRKGAPMQRSSVTRFSKKLIIASLSFFLTIGLMLPGFFATPAQAGARTCLTVISGNGPEGTTDAVVQFLDSSNVYQDAFI